MPVYDTLFLSSICCARPQYAVPVLDMLCLCSIGCACPRYPALAFNTLCLCSIGCACHKYAVVCSIHAVPPIRCACPQYAVPVLNTLSWPFAVPVPIRNRILTLIPLYRKPNRSSAAATKIPKWNKSCENANLIPVLLLSFESQTVVFLGAFKTDVSIFRVISFYASWKFLLWLGNSAWDFLGD